MERGELVGGEFARGRNHFHSADVERQYNEAISTGEMDVELSKYSYMEAKSRVQVCYHFPIHDDHFYGAFLHPVQRHASEYSCKRTSAVHNT